MLPHDTPLPQQQSVVDNIISYANARNITVTFENLE